jgi:hypothetical protein
MDNPNEDWTEGNSSKTYLDLVDAVDNVLLDSGFVLIRGGHKTVAAHIVSMLAHQHGLIPKTEGKEEEG